MHMSMEYSHLIFMFFQMVLVVATHIEYVSNVIYIQTNTRTHCKRQANNLSSF